MRTPNHQSSGNTGEFYRHFWQQKRGNPKQAVHILMEGTPPEIDLSLLEAKLMEIPSVVAVRDLHVWRVTSGADAMSGHLVVRDMGTARATLKAAQASMKASFGLSHVTIQIEDESFHAAEPQQLF